MGQHVSDDSIQWGGWHTPQTCGVSCAVIGREPLGSAAGAKRLSVFTLFLLRFVEYERIFPKQTNPFYFLLSFEFNFLKSYLFGNRNLNHDKTNGMEVQRGTHCLVVGEDLFQTRRVAAGMTDIL